MSPLDSTTCNRCQTWVWNEARGVDFIKDAYFCTVSYNIVAGWSDNIVAGWSDSLLQLHQYGLHYYKYTSLVGLIILCMSAATALYPGETINYLQLQNLSKWKVLAQFNCVIAETKEDPAVKWESARAAADDSPAELFCIPQSWSLKPTLTSLPLLPRPSRYHATGCRQARIAEVFPSICSFFAWHMWRINTVVKRTMMYAKMITSPMTIETIPRRRAFHPSCMEPS